MNKKPVRNLLFRVPDDLFEDVAVELDWAGMFGQRFIEELVRARLEKKDSRAVNYRGETRSDVRRRLFPTKKPVVKLRKKIEASSLV